MNATFTLTQPSAASPLLTRLDMSDLENVKDARAGLLAAGNDVAKLAVWAGRWGAALCDRCLESEGGVTEPDIVDELESDLRDAEARSRDLEKAIHEGAAAIDRLLEREERELAAKHFGAISKIGDDLEAAL